MPTRIHLTNFINDQEQRGKVHLCNLHDSNIMITCTC